MKRPTEDQLETMVQLVRAGNTLDSVCVYVGYEAAEFDAWLRKPRNRVANARIQKAISEADIQDVNTIKASSDGMAWQAANARLTHRRNSERERDLYRLRALTTD